MAGNDAATLLMVAGISTWTPRRSVMVRVVAADCSVVLEDVDWVVVVPVEHAARDRMRAEGGSCLYIFYHSIRQMWLKTCEGTLGVLSSLLYKVFK